MNRTRLAALALTLAFTTACSSTSEAAAPTMPDVVGEQLDTAIAQIKAAGIDEPEIDGGGMFGVVEEANWTVCGQIPQAGADIAGTPTLTVDRSCGEDEATEEAEADADSAEDSATTAAVDTTVPESNAASAQPYAHNGPAYEVVTVDERAGLGTLDEYSVFTDALDYSTDDYRDQIKAIITDVAHSAQTDKLLVNVVTDREIALAEAASTYEGFMAERGTDYVINVIPKKEETGWVALYVGGIDSDKAELSDSEASFEILWFGYPDNAEFEKWKP